MDTTGDCGKNCGEQFILQISTRDICQEILSLLQNKTQQQGVRNKLHLIESWKKQYACFCRLLDWALFKMMIATEVTNDPQILPLGYNHQTPQEEKTFKKDLS